MAMTQTALKMAEADSVSYRIQKWTVAENSKYSQKIIRVMVSACINHLAAKICEEIPQISYEEAEARAYLLTSTYDHYNYLYWFYVDHMDVKSSKHRFLENLQTCDYTTT